MKFPQNKQAKKMDIIYVTGGLELGCLEIGSSDVTKDWRDSRVKMPIVMKDVLLELVGATLFIATRAHIDVYSISRRWKMYIIKIFEQIILISLYQMTE